MAFERSLKVDDLKNLLSPLCGAPADDIRVVKARPFQLKKLQSIPDLDWFGFDLGPQSTIGGQPWNVKDGDYILYKDSRKKEVHRSTAGRISAVAAADGELKKKPSGRSHEAGITIYSLEEQRERRARLDAERKDREAEDEKLRAEAAERIRLGRGKTAEELKAEETHVAAKAQQLAEMEQARQDAIDRAAMGADKRVKLV